MNLKDRLDQMKPQADSLAKAVSTLEPISKGEIDRKAEAARQRYDDAVKAELVQKASSA